MSQPARPMWDRILAGSVSILAGPICHKGMSPMQWTLLSVQTLLLRRLNVDEDAFFILTGWMHFTTSSWQCSNYGSGEARGKTRYILRILKYDVQHQTSPNTLLPAHPPILSKTTSHWALLTETRLHCPTSQKHIWVTPTSTNHIQPAP